MLAGDRAQPTIGKCDDPGDDFAITEPYAELHAHSHRPLPPLHQTEYVAGPAAALHAVDHGDDAFRGLEHCLENQCAFAITAGYAVWFRPRGNDPAPVLGRAEQ